MNGRTTDGTVHALVVNPWRRVWSPWCRRAQAVRGIELTESPIDCAACAQLAEHVTKG